MSNRLDIHYGRRGGHLQPGIIRIEPDPLCSICGQPMSAGQTGAHVVCLAAQDDDNGGTLFGGDA
jgi:hypothetical protein